MRYAAFFIAIVIVVLSCAGALTVSDATVQIGESDKYQRLLHYGELESHNNGFTIVGDSIDTPYGRLKFSGFQTPDGMLGVIAIPGIGNAIVGKSVYTSFGSDSVSVEIGDESAEVNSRNGSGWSQLWTGADYEDNPATLLRLSVDNGHDLWFDFDYKQGLRYATGDSLDTGTWKTHFQIDSSGYIILSLPSDSAGIPEGALYEENGLVKVR